MARPRLRFSHLLRQYFPRRLRWSEESKRRLGLLCGHAGYVTGLFEYVMTDILHLRIFALTGCALIVSFQALQPRRQWISVSWNSIYCAVNLFHISLLLQERPRSLCKEEEELQRVLGEHVLHQQILSLSEAGEWQRLCGGLLVEEGQEQSAQVRIIVSGHCDVYIRGLKVGELSPGAAVGAEVLALRLLGPATATETGEEAVAKATVECRDEVFCLCLPWSWLKSEPNLMEALRKGFATSLAAQVAAGDKAARLLEYGAVLEMACYSAALVPDSGAAPSGLRRAVTRIWGPSPPSTSPKRGSTRKVAVGSIPSLTVPMLEEALERLRAQLGISHEEHCMVVETLPKDCHGNKFLRLSGELAAD
ncbi:unnamed protein product [Cladocopium goreaui]|uniref:Reticulocyte-binding protein 2-like a n=1 Tax=Cladocopium goreaui TaxID=2562237 RepID=A0A9P1D660_9DINO|nr:unnamed protein product [Cladocopium goreaui]